MSSVMLVHHGIKGMRWGVRRYQNPDGSLTPAGQKRYDRDVRENNAKKKDNRIKDLEETGPDPNRWVTEDLHRSKQAIDAVSNLNKEFQKFEKDTAPKPVAKKMDLSKMTDQELRDRINREILEQQYTKLFAEVNPVKVSKGRQICHDVLETTGSLLAVTSSAIGIALTVKQLKG